MQTPRMPTEYAEENIEERGYADFSATKQRTSETSKNPIKVGKNFSKHQGPSMSSANNLASRKRTSVTVENSTQVAEDAPKEEKFGDSKGKNSDRQKS